jgi:putative Mg2+ transporter-C (MgtC) family protein
MDLPQLSDPAGRILFSVALAMGLGAFLGMEREAAGKPAGLRTNMLVAGSAALLVGLSEILVGRFREEIGSGVIRSDPIRVIQAIIIGVSFLGAGTIIRRESKQHVEGLTTAASLLFATAIGICAALSQEMLAVLITLMVVAVLKLLGFIELWISKDEAVSEESEDG